MELIPFLFLEVTGAIEYEVYIYGYILYNLSATTSQATEFRMTVLHSDRMALELTYTGIISMQDDCVFTCSFVSQYGRHQNLALSNQVLCLGT